MVCIARFFSALMAPPAGTFVNKGSLLDVWFQCIHRGPQKGLGRLAASDRACVRACVRAAFCFLVKAQGQHKKKKAS